MLPIAAVVLTATAALRGGEYDEQYTLFVTAGVARPVWPTGAFAAGDVRQIQAGHASFFGIARDLRSTDVHPPLYFWAVAAWRAIAGNGLFVARLASVAFAMAALIAIGIIAWLTDIPAALAMALTLGCYGFAYTGSIARGFALAQMLTLSGVALLLVADQHGRRDIALLAGLLFGAATFTNYLAAFVAIASLVWLGLRRTGWLNGGNDTPASHLRRSDNNSVWPIAAVGFAVWLPADLWFFLAQRGSRSGQFPPLHMLPSLARLGQYLAANVFGGLPLYVEGTARTALGAGLATAFLALTGLVALRWRHIAQPGPRLLFAMAASAPPIGLLLLGAAFNNMPIELRYIAFATPFIGLLLAACLASLPKQWELILGASVLAIQSAALVGLMVRPETMQPARATAAAAATIARDGVVLLPRGNDGAAIVGSFAIEAPVALRILVVDRVESAAQIRARTAPYRRVTLALLAQDTASRATLPTMSAAFATPCWRHVADGFNVIAFERICARE